MTETPQVRHDASRHRFEALLDGRVAGFISYREADGVLDLRHTEVDPAFEGRGVGSALVRGALDAVRASGGTVVPTCPFIRGWIDKHADYADLVA